MFFYKLIKKKKEKKKEKLKDLKNKFQKKTKIILNHY